MAQTLISVSISHRGAPVDVRERLYLKEPEARQVMSQMKPEIAREVLILSTCNRTELYALPANEDVTSDYLIEYLLLRKAIPQHETTTYKAYFERLSYCDAIEHLFRVASGIDSMVTGDHQIFSQVKDAFRIASETGAAGGVMTKLAHAAFRTAKRVISETQLMSGASTISYAAVELARKIYDDLRNKHVLIVGAGETAELAAKHFLERGAKNITAANRSVDNANEMLARLEAGSHRAVSLDELPNVLSEADIVLTATGAPGFVITRDMVSAALRARSSSTPLVLIDIAVPRDIEPAAAGLPNVFVKDIDDLQAMVDRNLERKRQEIPKAEAIVKEEVQNFIESLSKLEVAPTIKELRDKFEAVRHEELERQRGKLDEKTFAMVDEMSRRMMNRLLHQPMVTLKEPHGAMDDMLTKIEIVRKLFALDESAKEE
jgi:glutamyl-tRNA reductase